MKNISRGASMHTMQRLSFRHTTCFHYLTTEMLRIPSDVLERLGDRAKEQPIEGGDSAVPGGTARAAG
jgi:hypothetical protein